MLSLLIGLLLLGVQESKTQAKRIIHCAVQSQSILTCFDEETEKEFPIAVNSRHPWAKHLSDTQPGVAKVIVEQRGNKYCLMQVHVQGDWVRNPVNERINVCVRRGKR